MNIMMKKAARLSTKLEHIRQQIASMVADADTETEPSSAFLAHCQEKMEFLAERERRLAKRFRRLYQPKIIEEASKILTPLMTKLLQTGKVMVSTKRTNHESLASSLEIESIGHEIRDADGRIIAWTTDELIAQVIARLLNENEDLLNKENMKCH